MNSYFTHVDNIFSDTTRKKLLDIARQPGAFQDISYGISFFKHPLKLDELEIKGPWRLQLLKQSVPVSEIHKDRNRRNEYDNIEMPRATVISWPLSGKGETWFYDEYENPVERVVYKEGQGAILNTGEKYHNVMLTSSEPRIVVQMCFSEPYERIVELYESSISSWSY